MSNMPFLDYRVVELGSGNAGAYCGKLFADFGATVVKVEPPGGDPGRIQFPLVDIGGGAQESGYFAWLNTNKQSIIADVASEADALRVRNLLSKSNLLIDTRMPADLRNSWLTHDLLRRENSQLVIAAVTWFGDSGPYRDFAATDTICRALAGLIKLSGPVEGPPAMLHSGQAEILGGVTAFIAAAAGLVARDRGGRRFSVSVHESNIALAEQFVAPGIGGEFPEKRLGVNRFAPFYPVGIYPCREGWLSLSLQTAGPWRTFWTIMGKPEVLENPNFATTADRMRHADEVDALLLPLLKKRTAAEWFAFALEHKLAFVVVPSIAELLAQPVFRDRGSFAQVHLANANFEAPVVPQRLTRTPPRAGGRAPLAGTDDAGYPKNLGSNFHIGQTPADPMGLPLAGLRIVDLTMGWSGPLCTRQLADLGAEVIKIESCKFPDWFRGSTDNKPNFFEQRLYEKHPTFQVMNRNKIGITLDLTSPEGVELAKRLVANSHAVVENSSREVLPKLGLDYEALRQVKPDVIMVSMSAFGVRGAWANCRAFGQTMEAAAGLPSVTGNPDWPPTMNLAAYGDAVGGLNAAAALLIAVIHRQRTGEGQHVDLAQVECMLPLVAPWIIEQSATGKLSPRLGNRHPMFVPHGCFPCNGKDAWVVVAVTSDDQWPLLCRTIGRDDFAADPLLRSAEGRRTQQDTIEAALAAWTCKRSADEAMMELQTVGIAAGAVRSPLELYEDPHLASRGFWQEVNRAHIGRHRLPSAAFRDGNTPIAVRRPAPTLGQDNEAILTGILGLSASNIQRLAALGVIGTEMVSPKRLASLEE